MGCIEISWIKLNVNLFDDEKIKVILSFPDGDKIVLCWIRLLCMAGKSSSAGHIIIGKNIPYTPDMLSTLWGVSKPTVVLALETFKRFEMIDIKDNGVIFIVNFDKHNGQIDRLTKMREAGRVRTAVYRERLRSNGITRSILPMPSDDDVCTYCGEKAECYDHKIPVTRGGSDEPDNLTPCCAFCNREKNNKTVDEYLLYREEKKRIDKSRVEWSHNRDITVTSQKYTKQEQTNTIKTKKRYPFIAEAIKNEAPAKVREAFFQDYSRWMEYYKTAQPTVNQMIQKIEYSLCS